MSEFGRDSCSASPVVTVTPAPLVHLEISLGLSNSWCFEDTN